MLYAVAKKEFTNQVVTFADWPAVKEEQPLKQLPTLKTEGQVLCQSNVIARHVARRLDSARRRMAICSTRVL
ncbi:hypothetical protein EB796_025118 [Bugula neritina]|uniref:GST N-terminal domain-containing protein n=1 Tax=Bugula neritina TaxID=10212 RepID=A0A7J7IT49_BUGNE|nr:hypothetical protein EB796_025118 [Bugula neritina]